ncbi:MAG: 2-oxoglutarate dehydrogenase complex dihydrolipoyllysine-residue succinyltransferase [Bacteroidetes bacterium]|nr:2-oxoglutarate dehydrogenase complex dihydrolipoyllysine-residue succinyltransferase [Bacteroidota bacterium]
MAIEIRIPSVGESVTEVTLARWLVGNGEQVAMDQALCELETDKASQEIFSPSAGAISIVAQAGADLRIGDLLATIAPGTGAAVIAAPSAPVAPTEPIPALTQSPPQQTPAPANAQGHPSPAAAKILAEKRVETSQVQGSGIGGRITKGDALAISPAQPTAQESDAGADWPIDSSSSAIEPARMATRAKMSRLRQTIAKKLVEVKNGTAMLTTFNEIDMGNVMELRKRYKDAFKEKHDIGLGFMSFFTKAVTLALKEFPSVNGKIAGNEIITYNYADIGIAVSTERGLVVPIIRNAQERSLAQIEREVLSLALKARDNKLSLEDMEGGTFSITNGGVFGSMLSTPIINGDQSAILGMHNIVERPVAIQGEVKIRPVMYVALSYDHRIIDGKESVGFLYRVKEYIEDPARLLLEV